MKTKWKIGAALLALAILPAAAFLFHVSGATLCNLSILGLAGAVVFTYDSFQHTGAFGGGFTGGDATAPTATQAKQIERQSGTVSFTDADTTWVFTHNWGLSAAQAAAHLPDVIVNMIAGQQALGTAVVPNIAVDVTSDTNVVTFNKLADTGSGCTLSITLRRAHSIGL